MNRLIPLMFALIALTLPLFPAFGADSTADRNKASLRQFYEDVFNAGHLEHVEKYITADALEHEVAPGKTDPQNCRESVKEFLTEFRKAFPDLKIKIEDLIAEGDKVVARCTMSGTHKGEFMGMPATGKRFSVQIIDILRMKDGKVVEHWGGADMAALMEQLGASKAK